MPVRARQGPKLVVCRAKLGDEIIEAIECLKSWAREDLVYGPGSKIRQVEAMPRDLEQRAAELEG
jgi:hypothetical protein